jgi:uncharacterized protein (UPF0210 family)
MNTKMIIRSITYTINLEKIDDTEYLKNVQKNVQSIKSIYENENIFIRTIRFNIVDINDFEENTLLVQIDKLSKFVNDLSMRWFNISFNLINQTENKIDSVCDIALKILGQYSNSFINFIVASDYINNYAVLKSSQLIKDISILNENGIDNFRFGVSLNVEANTPFFPFSYSSHNDSFSLAIETTKSFISSIATSNIINYEKLKYTIKDNLKNDLVLFQKLSETVSEKLNIIYNGQDISLSPYPDENISVIDILNLLGIKNFGSNGTQFLTSYLTSILKETIKEYNLKSVGFNGVMYSLLEDKLMCKANDKKDFSIDSVILYSTVCGCGLDMLPLPYNTSKLEIASMILDVATTAIKLNKPLGVRVLPIPSKITGDYTDLKLDFLTNTKIPEVKYINIDENLFKINKFYIK